MKIFFGARFSLTVIFTCLLASSVSHALAAFNTAWPSIALPANVHLTSIGEQLSLNGMPMRVQTFLSSTPPQELAAYFRHQLGQSSVENIVDSKTILGRSYGSKNEYYLTIQIEPAGGATNKGSRGIIAVTHLEAAYAKHAQTQADHAQWLSHLPAGSHLTSSLSSSDNGSLSRHLVITNHHGETLNRTHLKKMMRQKGFELEHETAPHTRHLNGKTLYFKGKNKEAMATISRDTHSQTIVVLNILTTRKFFK